MHAKRTIWVLASGLALLLAWGVAQEEFEPAAAVTEELLASDHCVAHEFSLPPQGFHISGSGFHISGSGFHISGSTGGMVIGDIVYEDRTGSHEPTAVSPATVSDVVNSVLATPLKYLLSEPLAQDVAIVVADDFAGGRYEPPAALFGSLDLDQLEELITSGDFSHGALVMHHLNSAIAATEGYGLVSRSGPITAWQDRATGHHLVVAALDMSGSSGPARGMPVIPVQQVFTSLTQGVNELLSDLEATYDLGGAVINMSWVLLPCATVEEFIANAGTYSTIWDYLIGLGLDPNIDLGEVLRVLSEVDTWPLRALLDTGRYAYGAWPLEFVAASGNFSMPYQMLPALGDNVVGVAVEPVLRDFPGRYSNIGDVHLPAEWFVLQDIDATGVLGPATPISYAGTSYTAPLVSLFIAEDLVGVGRCTPSAPSRPPLTTDAAGNQYPAPADVPLEVAVGDCQ
ncbi:MAG TPA: hypothetical protein VFF10_11105 [Trueperaceae bacterium]|nr:hypothetical protein [Trueperaceae bacterium]